MIIRRKVKVKNEDLSFIGHLGELRRRLIFVLVAFLLFFLAAFLFVEEIYSWLVKDLQTVGDLEGKLAILGPTDILRIYLMIAGVFALAVTLPFAALQVWQFVKSALTKEERRVTLSFIPAIFFLFAGGISFGYFILFPLVLQFLTGLAMEQMVTLFTAEKYFRFLLNLTLPFGFLFQMPILVMFLTRLGILNPKQLSKMRRYAYLALVIVAVIVTPPDFISDILVTIPLILLYEFSITFSRIVYRKRVERMESEVS